MSYKDERNPVDQLEHELVNDVRTVKNTVKTAKKIKNFVDSRQEKNSNETADNKKQSENTPNGANSAANKTSEVATEGGSKASETAGKAATEAAEAAAKEAGKQAIEAATGPVGAAIKAFRIARKVAKAKEIKDKADGPVKALLGGTVALFMLLIICFSGGQVMTVPGINGGTTEIYMQTGAAGLAFNTYMNINRLKDAENGNWLAYYAETAVQDVVNGVAEAVGMIPEMVKFLGHSVESMLDTFRTETVQYSSAEDADGYIVDKLGSTYEEENVYWGVVESIDNEEMFGTQLDALKTVIQHLGFKKGMVDCTNAALMSLKWLFKTGTGDIYKTGDQVKWWCTLYEGYEGEEYTYYDYDYTKEQIEILRDEVASGSDDLWQEVYKDVNYAEFFAVMQQANDLTFSKNEDDDSLEIQAYSLENFKEYFKTVIKREHLYRYNFEKTMIPEERLEELKDSWDMDVSGIASNPDNRIYYFELVIEPYTLEELYEFFGVDAYAMNNVYKKTQNRDVLDEIEMVLRCYSDENYSNYVDGTKHQDLEQTKNGYYDYGGNARTEWDDGFDRFISIAELLNIEIKTESNTSDEFTDPQGSNSEADQVWDEYQTLLNAGDLDAAEKLIVEYALAKEGMAYDQEKRTSEGYYDCSSLVSRVYREAGIDWTKGANPVAAEEYKILDQAGYTFTYTGTDNLRPGDLIFYNYKGDFDNNPNTPDTYNGRYGDVSHVSIYVGNGMVVSATGKKVGVEVKDLPTGSIVAVGRPLAYVNGEGIEEK